MVLLLISVKYLPLWHFVWNSPMTQYIHKIWYILYFKSAKMCACICVHVCYFPCTGFMIGNISNILDDSLLFNFCLQEANILTYLITYCSSIPTGDNGYPPPIPINTWVNALRGLDLEIRLKLCWSNFLHSGREKPGRGSTRGQSLVRRGRLALNPFIFGRMGIFLAESTGSEIPC